MGTWRIAGMNSFGRGGPALVAALAVGAAVLAGPGPAAAAARPGQPGVAGGPQPGTAGVISTVAGGVGGPAIATRLVIGSCGVASGDGKVYIATGETVRKMSPGSDWLTTPAGTGVPGKSSGGGPAVRAGLNAACGVSVDGSGNLLIADTQNQRVQVVATRTGTFYGQAMLARHIYSVAGTGKAGFSGDGGPATSAELNDPYGVAVDSAGNLLIADYYNSRIRVVAASTGTFYGQAMTTGDIYTVAGGGTGGVGDGGPATSAELGLPQGVAVDGAGNLLIADTYNERVRVVAASTGTFYGQAMTTGDIYTVAGTGKHGFSGDGGPGTSAKVDTPAGVAVDGAGNLLIADTYNNRVRVVAASTGTFYGKAMTAGDIYNVAGTGTQGFSGDGGPATSAELGLPRGVAVDGAGNLLIADGMRVVAASTGTFYGKAMTAGDIYTVAGGGTGGPGDGGPATRAQLGPTGVAVDGAGNQIIADLGNNRIRVAAASTGTFYGQAMTTGDIYTVAGTGKIGFSGDGGPATSAELNDPYGVAVDGAGNLLIADTDSNRVRVVAASTGTFYGQAMTAGDIYTVAGTGENGFSGDGGPATGAELWDPYGVAVDGAGNLLIADTDNSRIRVVAASTGTFYGQAMTAGDIYTVAGGSTYGFSGDGGPATSAKLNHPEGMAVDSAGNLVIADWGNNRIRVVAASTGTFYGQAMTAGDIYTVAGGGTGGLGDGGPATSAKLEEPSVVAVDGAGNLVIADTGNSRIRVVAASTGSFYGQAMTAGDIYTVAGTGKHGFSGDSGPATSAKLYDPESVAVDGAGNLLIADTGNSRIREVTG